MAFFKLFIKRVLINLLKLSGRYKKSAGLPNGVVTIEQLPASAKIILEREDNAVTRKPPVTIGAVHKNFTKRLYTPAKKVFVLAGNNWRVWGNQGGVITAENYLFKDVSREFDDRIHSIFNQFKLIPPIHTSERVAVLAASGGSVYYHWMFDILPRIMLLKQSGEFDKIDKFIADYADGKYQAETLARAGIKPAQIIASDNHWGFHLQARELVVPSLVSPLDVPSLAACQYLRGLYAEELAVTDQRTKIYIQRLSGRSIINEDELLTYLETLDIQIVHPEKLTVAQQAKLFAGTDLVIGAHGAGLTNIVFCKPGTIIIDLFSAEWINPCYWVIAEHIKLKYGYLEGRKIKKSNSPKTAGILVDVAKLKLLINKLNEN